LRAHPVGITAEWPGGTNGDLLDTRADWIAPNVSRPDPASGTKVVIADTDHLCGVCGDPGFPWRAMTRGLNPLFMDPYDGKATGLGALDEDYRESRWETIRRRLGVTQHLGERLDFSRLEPRAGLSSTRFCLADAQRGTLYLVYAERGGVFAVDLSRSRGRLSVEWIDPDTGASSPAGSVEGGAWQIFTAPRHGDAVLLVRAAA
jgi:hypothetical protein